MSNPLETVFDEFAQVTETSILNMAEQIRAFRVEIDLMREEHRSSAPLVTPAEVRAGPAGRDGIDGKDGRDGKDAVVDTDEIVARVASVAVPRVLEKVPTPVNGQDGAPGERGSDGLVSIEDVKREVREASALHFRTAYQGVFRDDAEYQTGQFSTWDGSMWVATRDTNGKPGTDNSGWQLVVKKGRDAKR